MSRNGLFLVCSAFPLSLVRRRVVIEPCDITQVQRMLSQRPFVSCWGHENTIALASKLLAVDVTPKSKRPAVMLDEEQYPMLEGASFSECLVLSPNYVPGFRPAVGEEVGIEKITGWHALHIRWETEATAINKESPS